MTTATIEWPEWLSVTSKRVQCGDHEADEVRMSMPCKTSLTETAGDNGTMYDCAWRALMVRVEISDAVAARLAPAAYEKMAKLIAAAFHRRVWRNHLDRSNEVNGYGWNEEQLRTIQGLISYEAKHGQDDAMMRWALEEGDKVFQLGLTDKQIENIIHAAADYRSEVAELPA